MQLTDEEKIVMNEKVCQLPIIQELKSNDAELMKGQRLIQEHLCEVDERLEDGSIFMKGLKEDIEQMSNRSEQMHLEVRNDLKDHKYQDIKSELKEKNEQIRKYKEKVWSIFKIILTGLIGIGSGGLTVYLFGT